MKLASGALYLSATDLANHLACRHLTRLDLEHALGQRERPAPSASLALLYQRGEEHEAAYVAHLAAQGLSVARLGRESTLDDTIERMRSGVDVIVQAPLASGRWRGIADVLLRVDGPSGLGAHSYEVVDTKLARETKGGTILQLCLYAEMVGEIQGVIPNAVHVVSPGNGYEPESFRTLDYLAYHRFVKARLEASVDSDGDGSGGEARRGETYPEPCEKCDSCAWRWTCDRRRRDDDHLSLVAGVRRDQRKELVARDVPTLAALAGIPLPLAFEPERGSVEGYERIREQARVQLEERETQRPVFELLLPPNEERGLARLPEPSPGDVFLDFEGDRYVEGGGIEYLFGYVTSIDGEPVYTARWATDREEEKAAFAALVDFLAARRSEDPACHVYHFAPYEPAAMKRLMTRYATREAEVDRLLRAEAFVDLHAVVKGALRAGVERYSIKELERYYGFERECDLDRASAALRGVQRALELRDVGCITAEARAEVEAYNRDDCVSALRLRDWLEEQRAALVRDGHVLQRPPVLDGAPPDERAEREAEVQALIDRLVEGVPADRDERTLEQRARWTLSLLVEWHWRELKVAFWEKFQRREADPDELLDDRNAIAWVRHGGFVRKEKRSSLHRFTFPVQEITLDAGTKVFDRAGGYVGTLFELDPRNGVLLLKTTREDVAGATDVFLPDPVVKQAPLERAVRRLAAWVAENGPDADGPFRAARDLLLRHPPRLRTGEAGVLRRPGEDVVDAGRRLALELDGGVLPIQGPPGTGKSYAGARMILSLVGAGKRVGVTALSHKAIRNLLDEIVLAAREEDAAVRIVQKVSERSEDPPQGIREIENPEVEGTVGGGEFDVLAGTAWLWARYADAPEPPVDVLVVDEAGQLSLANALAAAVGARSLVLLGDPQQLEQPQRGAQPDGADLSALEHVLTERDGTRHETMPPERGLFLDETYRMHASIAEPLSELFYEGRLVAHPSLDALELRGTDGLDGSGLVLVPVDHEGNSSRSDEELAGIRSLLDRLLRAGATWRDRKGAVHPLRIGDVMIVAPYNAQVANLQRGLPKGAVVGTVDRFQGQEAPVVIYSMTASSAEDAPRGMEFLYSANRLNVALSRARCRALLVASPRLFEPECRTPEQIELANALCRLREVAASFRCS